jgi:hypothetical protein
VVIVAVDVVVLLRASRGTPPAPAGFPSVVATVEVSPSPEMGSGYVSEIATTNGRAADGDRDKSTPHDRTDDHRGAKPAATQAPSPSPATGSTGSSPGGSSTGSTTGSGETNTNGNPSNDAGGGTPDDPGGGGGGTGPGGSGPGGSGGGGGGSGGGGGGGGGG